MKASHQCPRIRPHDVELDACFWHVDKRDKKCERVGCNFYEAEVGVRRTKIQRKLRYDGKGGVDD